MGVGEGAEGTRRLNAAVAAGGHQSGWGRSPLGHRRPGDELQFDLEHAWGARGELAGSASAANRLLRPSSSGAPCGNCVTCDLLSSGPIRFHSPSPHGSSAIHLGRGCGRCGGATDDQPGRGAQRVEGRVVSAQLGVERAAHSRVARPLEGRPHVVRAHRRPKLLREDRRLAPREGRPRGKRRVRAAACISAASCCASSRSPVAAGELSRRAGARAAREGTGRQLRSPLKPVDARIERTYVVVARAERRAAGAGPAPADRAHPPARACPGERGRPAHSASLHSASLHSLPRRQGHDLVRRQREALLGRRLAVAVPVLAVGLPLHEGRLKALLRAVPAPSRARASSAAGGGGGREARGSGTSGCGRRWRRRTF